MSIKVGDKAPEFTLKNQNTEDVSLSSFKGKNVVLLFFPFANTGVCTKEMCTMRDNYSRYTALNAQILGVSVDSPFSLKMWEEKNNLNFPLLSDFNKEVCKAYGAIHDVFAPGKFDYMGVAKRSAFVIDKNGLIKYAEVLDNPGEEPNYEKIKEALQG
ncbi:MAG TPA: peroxiredoxin [Ignavibacteriaceae bacterium]|nr:peroxiredoxin [Ignavibacteriaceae bacterium]